MDKENDVKVLRRGMQKINSSNDERNDDDDDDNILVIENKNEIKG